MMDHGYYFVVQEMDPTLGEIEVSHYDFHRNGTKTKTIIDLVPCKDIKRFEFDETRPQYSLKRQRMEEHIVTVDKIGEHRRTLRNNT